MIYFSDFVLFIFVVLGVIDILLVQLSKNRDESLPLRHDLDVTCDLIFNPQIVNYVITIAWQVLTRIRSDF